jgi:hypothetical protein
MRHLLHVCYLFLAIHGAFGQSKLESRDTVYLQQYRGTESFGRLGEKSNYLKHGKYQFKSAPSFSSDNTKIQHLSITGNYEQGKYQGLWEYKVGEYTLQLNGIENSNVINVDVALDGVERVLKLNYQKGKPQGTWEIVNYPIVGSKRQKEIQAGTFTFNEAIAVGSFNFKGYYQDLLIDGNLNAEGFLDGQMTLTYLYKNEKIKEIREYQNGFLLEVKLLTGSDFEIEKERITYDEVKLWLKDDYQIETDGIKYSIGDKGFGILFQNGYTSNDRKLTIQFTGNSFLEDFLGRFQRFGSNNSAEREEPNFKLTRRFKYHYPSNEKTILADLYPSLIGINNELSEVLTDPRLLLYGEADSEVAESIGFLNHAKGKVNVLIEIVELLNSDFFEYANRENYFQDGIVGLQASDSFTYLLNGAEKQAVFDLGITIDSSEDIISKIEQYTQDISRKIQLKFSLIGQKTRIFETQTQLDEIESEFYLKENRVDAMYGYFQRFDEGISDKDIPVHYRIYRSFRRGILESIRNSYISESSDERKLIQGSAYLEWLEFFETNFPRIKALDDMESRINSYFTILSPNPFFERPIESKILPQILGKSTTILIPYYLKTLVASKKTEDLLQQLEKLEQLESRLKKISENAESQEVLVIERALRRENYELRIERILQF